MSEKLARQLFDEARQFSAGLSGTGWTVLPDPEFVDHKSSADLFASEERPLVVGLFGGTGVGKSSLLNRLSGSDIARTGVVRPTSMEITAYLHQKIALDALPEHFSTDKFSAARHDNERLNNVMLVDMPDFDSNEVQNKDQVMQWMPHIDLLIYVVTPERYKDAEGWKMLLDHGYRHAWLFVMNQWDRGSPLQFDDFVGLLATAGFNTPQVFRTVGNKTADNKNSNTPDDDQFTDLVEVIVSLAQRKVIIQLQERGWLQRLSGLQSQLKTETTLLSASNQQTLQNSFNNHWEQFHQASVAHLDLSFKSHSALFAEKKVTAVNTVLKSLTGGSANSDVSDIAANISSRSDVKLLWDDWLTVRMQDTISKFLLAETEHGLPANSIASLASDATLDNARTSVTQQLQHSLDSAIKAPGLLWQRWLSRIASVLKILLPVLALVWVTWRVINGFIAGATDRSAYVGLDFLVNGMLLALLGWLIPMLTEKILVPSMPETVYRSLHQGLDNGLALIKEQFNERLESVNQERERLLSTGSDLGVRIDQLVSDSRITDDPVLRRLMLAAPKRPDTDL